MCGARGRILCIVGDRLRPAVEHADGQAAIGLISARKFAGLLTPYKERDVSSDADVGVRQVRRNVRFVLAD